MGPAAVLLLWAAAIWVYLWRPHAKGFLGVGALMARFIPGLMPSMGLPPLTIEDLISGAVSPIHAYDDWSERWRDVRGGCSVQVEAQV